jgi:membrane associated rhomboid family serine protease
MNTTETVKHLVIINVMFYLLANFVCPWMYESFPLYSFGTNEIQWNQFVTHMFMHARFPDFTHLLFNMIALYTFGSNLENAWGGKRFLFFYMICGIGAGLVNNLVDYYLGINTSAVGASGAIYGLLVASAIMFPDSEIYLYFAIPIKSKYLVPGLILLDLFSGFTGFSIFGTGIAHFAHVGGALVGFIIMMIWKNKRFEHTRWN